MTSLARWLSITASCATTCTATGGRGQPTQAYTHHDTLSHLLNALDIECAAVLGMSMRRGVAIDFALTHSEQLSALLFLVPSRTGYPMGTATLALARPPGEVFTAGDFVHGIELAVRLWVDGQERGPEEVDSTVRERFRILYTDVLRRSRQHGRQPDALEPPAYTRLADLGMIQAPTLIVVGIGDIPEVQDQADLLARTILHARTLPLPRVAHLFNLERPTEGRIISSCAKHGQILA
jgi:pimeloyl-ACP methyl ester carboxylesterase